MYEELYPDEKDITESDIDIVTLKNVVAEKEYNDFGMMVRNKDGEERTVVLVEAQSTWSDAIVYRALLYLVATYREYTDRHEIDIYGPAFQLPAPEIYVLYTGEKNIDKKQLSLSELMLGGHKKLELIVDVIQGKSGNGIIYQYSEFTRIVDRTVKQHGKSYESFRMAIAECKRKGILVEYLTERESEVISMLDLLYDQETAIERKIKATFREGKVEGIAEGVEKAINALKALGYTEEQINTIRKQMV